MAKRKANMVPPTVGSKAPKGIKRPIPAIPVLSGAKTGRGGARARNKAGVNDPIPTPKRLP